MAHWIDYDFQYKGSLIAPILGLYCVKTLGSEMWFITTKHLVYDYPSHNKIYRINNQKVNQSSFYTINDFEICIFPDNIMC